MFGPICFSIEKEQMSSLPLTDQTKLVCFPGCIRQLVWGCHSNFSVSRHYSLAHKLYKSQVRF